MSIIYRKEALNPSERNSPFIFGKIQTAPAAINNGKSYSSQTK